MKIVDIYFIKSLTNLDNLYQIVSSERISVPNESSWNDKLRCMSLVEFVRQSDLLKDNRADLSQKVTDILNKLSMNPDIDVGEVNELTSLLRLNGFALITVERNDLGSESIDADPSFGMRELMISNALSESKLIESYTGMGFDVDDQNVGKATSWDFLGYFNLSDDEMNQADLRIPYNKYLVLRSKGNFDKIDQSQMRDYMLSRGFNYYRLYSM